MLSFDMRSIVFQCVNVLRSQKRDLSFSIMDMIAEGVSVPRATIFSLYYVVDVTCIKILSSAYL